MTMRVSFLAGLVVALTLNGCGGGGGGGGGDNVPSDIGDSPTGNIGAVPASLADEPVVTYSTTERDGTWSRVDLIPVFQGSPTNLAAPSSAEFQALLNKLQTLSGTNFAGNWSGTAPDLPTTNFNSYLTGVPPGTLAGYILAANNIYDLLQSTTGPPTDGSLLPVEFTTDQPFFPGFTGGDIDSQFPTGDPGSEGGPGLFSNFPNPPLAPLPPGRAVPPKLATLPNTMGGEPGTSGRGAQDDDPLTSFSEADEHQFIQMDFPYVLDRDSLFNDFDSNNSFLGDGTSNVKVVKHWVQRPETAPGIFGQSNAVDSPAGLPPEHVTGIAIIGGVSSVPITPGLGAFAFVDTSVSNLSNLPTGARDLVADSSVMTYIAYESIPPTGLPKLTFPQPAATDAYIVSAGPSEGMLVLPDPTAGKGGRVFGATPPEVGSVNDFATDGDDLAAAVGFISFEIESLRTAGKTVKAPYFHSFPVDQSNVGDDDPRAVFGSYNRGAAIAVSTGQVPSIDILDPTKDVIGPYDPQPASDAINTISTRARFLVEFDREVVPNSVGFSRRHTLHSTQALGVVFPFNGNTRPIQNPINQFSSKPPGSPLAASIYLAVNQPAGVNLLTQLLQPVASPYQTMGAPAVSPLGTFSDDTGAPVNAEISGLTPIEQNQLGSLPRAIVPCDIYPLNQNNLQAYVVQPLIELPPGTIVTLGVTMNGLGTTFYGMVNHGNHTRVGTMFTPYQGLNLTTGLGTDASIKQAVIANNTIVKVNAGPMSLDGLLFYGGTNVALSRKTNQDPDGADNLTTGGYNVARTFKIGFDDAKLYINAPVSPQAMYLGFTTGGAGVLDLSGNGYTTNVPGGGLNNAPNKFYLESSRFLPAFTQTPSFTGFNWVQGGSELGGDHRRAFGILGRYTAGIGGFGLNIESDLAVGAAIPTGSLTPQPGINEGSSGYETLVRSGVVQGDPASSTVVLAPVSKVGIVTDIEVGDFLDTLYFDPENPWVASGHTTYNTPLQGTLDNNTIADPPTPNPPPLRFPVGLPHTAVLFDQNDLIKPPFLIDGNEVFPSDSFFAWESGSFISGAPNPVNGLIFLNPVTNATGSSSDQPQLPNFGFLNTFVGSTIVVNPSYVQTGPAPKTCTGPGALLAAINSAAAGFANPSGLKVPYFQSRQQLGNFLFVADQTNNKVHALNSNTMEILESIKLPDPRGLGLTADLRKLFVSNEGDASVSIIDADPTHAGTFMTELKRVKVGTGPRAVTCNPDGEDVFVMNFSGNSISILDQSTGNVRKTLISNGINRPYDMAVGMREDFAGPAFASGCYHGYVSNFGGNNVLVYESGPDGLAGIGFDNIISEVTSDTPGADGQVWKKMRSPRGITFDPNSPLSGFSNLSIGCYVAHQDDQGRALVSRIIYSKDSQPGPEIFNTTFFTFTGDKVFEVKNQYVSSLTGVAFDVALPDYNRTRFENEDFRSYHNLLNAGATPKTLPVVERNWKFPLALNIQPFGLNIPRWEPDRLYFSVGGSNAQKLIEVFDLVTGNHLKTITTPSQVGVMASYFSQ